MSNFQLTESNYENVRAVLQATYDDSDKLEKALFEQLEQLPKISSLDIGQLSLFISQ